MERRHPIAFWASIGTVCALATVFIIGARLLPALSPSPARVASVAYAQPPVTTVLFPSAARTVTANSVDQSNPLTARGVLLYLNISAASGTTPTLDVKVQVKDPTSAVYVDVPAGAFAQKITTGADTLLLYPGVAVTANRQVSAAIGLLWRAVVTIGGTTPSFTFSLTADYLP